MIAIRKYDITVTGKDGKVVESSFLDNFNAILVRFRMLINTADTINNSKVEENYKNRIYILFYSKILWNTKSGIFDKHKDKMLDDNDDCSKILYNYTDLSLDTFEYLKAKNHIINSPHKKEVNTTLSKYKALLELKYPELV